MMKTESRPMDRKPPDRSICRSVGRSVYPFVHLSSSTHLPMYPCIYPHIHASIDPSIHPSIHVCIHYLNYITSLLTYISCTDYCSLFDLCFFSSPRDYPTGLSYVSGVEPANIMHILIQILFILVCLCKGICVCICFSIFCIGYDVTHW